MLDEGTHSYSAIARTLSLGNKTVARIAHNIELSNAPYPPSCVVKGRPRALTAAQEDVSGVRMPHEPQTNGCWLVHTQIFQ